MDPTIATPQSDHKTEIPASRASIARTTTTLAAEKIRACYQRSKARDIYDLAMFATRPLEQALIRRLVVLKLWQARDNFDPARLMKQFRDGRDFDWDDLGQLVRRTMVVDRDRITADCARGFAFLAELTGEERALAHDSHQRERDVWERLRREMQA